MSDDGKQLESLVAFVEEHLLPPGFEVRSNERVFNDEGTQIAEFDIEIKGKVGTTSIAWLIECRDRPGHGAAPASWIEQLVGRRLRFGFNKVTAVSTTGFSVGAKDYARQQGIELREVASIEAREFEDWLQVQAIQSVKRISDLHHANVHLHDNQNVELNKAALELITKVEGHAEILVSSLNGNRVNFSQVFLGVVQQVKPDLFDGVEPGKPKKIHIHGQYSKDDYFSIETEAGLARVEEIEFFGELRIEEEMLPVVKTVEYRHLETGESISQTASFAPQTLEGMKLAVELHRFEESGETHVTMRRLPDDA